MTEKKSAVQRLENVQRLAVVAAPDLKLLIERLLPFASTDDALPGLRCVWFAADRQAKTLTGTATDRYIMGRQSVAATLGAVRGLVYVDRAHLTVVIGWLKLVKTGAVQISATAETVTFKVVDAVASWSVPRYVGHQILPASKVTELLTPASGARMVSLNAKMLRKLPQVPHQFHVGEGLAPVACTTDDGLTAIIMPRRTPEAEASEPAPARSPKRRAVRR